MKKLHILLSMFPAILLAASCSGVRDCAPAQLNLPAEIAENAGDTLTAADIEWWKFYGDSALCTLISRTLEHNKDLLAATARIEELQQVYRINRSALFPEVGINIGANHETNDYYGKSYIPDPQFDLKATLRWEADLWGKLTWAKREGHAMWMSTVEDRRAMKISLIAEVATAYFNLIALDNELAIVRRTLENRKEGMAKAKLRFEGGLTSELVYQQTKVEYATAAAMVPNLEARIGMTENALSLLMGEYPGSIITRADTIAAMATSSNIPIGLPSTLLKRRPDLRSAQLKLKAAMAKVGIAHAERFPSLTFSLQGGLENDDLTNLLKSPFSYVAGAIAGPVFQFGKKKARYKAAIAAYDQARLGYEQRVLDAFRETNDTVVNYNNARETTSLKADSRNAAKKYVELAELQYRAGSINYIEVLDAQRRYLDAQIGLTTALRNQNIALVNLYKAIGGGWQ